MFLPFFINFVANMKPDLVIFEQPELANVLETFKDKPKKKKRKKDPVNSGGEGEDQPPKGVDLSKLEEAQL